MPHESLVREIEGQKMIGENAGTNLGTVIGERFGMILISFGYQGGENCCINIFGPQGGRTAGLWMKFDELKEMHKMIGEVIEKHEKDVEEKEQKYKEFREEIYGNRQV